MEAKTRILDQMRDVLRLTHMSLRTEEASLSWTKRFILFHDKRHPKDMGAPEIRAFLTSLAVQHQGAASTQNGALTPWSFSTARCYSNRFPIWSTSNAPNAPANCPRSLPARKSRQCWRTSAACPI